MIEAAALVVLCVSTGYVLSYIVARAIVALTYHPAARRHP
jgi:hypothetical protein